MREIGREFLILKGRAGWVWEEKARVGPWKGLSGAKPWTVGLQDQLIN